MGQNFALSEALLMSTHNICIRREIRKILCGYPLLSVAMIVKYFHIHSNGCHYHFTRSNQKFEQVHWTTK